MAPGPGRNVQLPASALQPTTSIYCTAALRPALSAHPSGLWGSERGTQNNNTTPEIQITSSAECKGNGKKRKKRRNYNMGGTGGVVVVVVVHQLFPSCRDCLSSRKKIYSPNDATNRCGSGSGGGEGGGEGGLQCEHSPKIMTQSFCCFFLVISLSRFPSQGFLGAWRSGWDCLDLRTVSYL